MAKKILIVGAGVAGLSTGIHACRNGYEVEIYEKHHLPGGLCTGWKRKGYTFEGCIHWLVGTRQGSQFNRLWREVFPIDSLEIINHEKFMSIEGEDGKTVHIYSDLDRLQEHLLQMFPSDHGSIIPLIESARVLAGAEFPLERAEELYRFWEFPLVMLKMMPLFKTLGRFSRISVAEYLGQIESTLLREVLSLIMPVGYSMTSLLSTLGSQHARDAGFPRGGSLEFARSIERRFLELGGSISYGSKVKRIMVEQGRAVGLLLENEREIRGDIIVSAADLHETVYGMLGGEYTTPLIEESFAALPTYTSAQVSFGLDCDLSGEAEKIALRLEKPIVLGGIENRYIYLTNYSFDPTMAPSGKTAVAATLYSSYEYWDRSGPGLESYRQKKELLAEKVADLVEKRYPAARGKIETADVATPATYNRYTGVYRGAYMAWIVPPSAGRFKLPKQLPGLDGFYLAGQWLSPPAGLPGSMLTGRHLVQLLCRSDGRSFRC